MVAGVVVVVGVVGVVVDGGAGVAAINVVVVPGVA